MRLIDADGLIEAYDREHEGEPGKARQLILDAPTIEERKTGRWIEFSNHNAYKCSECGRIIETVDGKRNVYKHYPYCHCGAKMEGET